MYVCMYFVLQCVQQGKHRGLRRLGEQSASCPRTDFGTPRSCWVPLQVDSALCAASCPLSRPRAAWLMGRSPGADLQHLDESLLLQWLALCWALRLRSERTRLGAQQALDRHPGPRPCGRSAAQDWYPEGLRAAAWRASAPRSCALAPPAAVRGGAGEGPHAPSAKYGPWARQEKGTVMVLKQKESFSLKTAHCQ